MRHFIRLRISIDGYSDANYYYNNELNTIGDFSTYYIYSNGHWYKYRRYRGRFIYSKESHYENSTGHKEWCDNRVWYNNYESYLLSVM